MLIKFFMRLRYNPPVWLVSTSFWLAYCASFDNAIAKQRPLEVYLEDCPAVTHRTRTAQGATTMQTYQPALCRKPMSECYDCQIADERQRARDAAARTARA